MTKIKCILLFLILLTTAGCITQFIPETNENQDLLVVEGLITDQPEENTIKLSRSLPLGIKSDAIPVTGCTVWISDDSQISYSLLEKKPGSYITDPLIFRAISGKKYTLHIRANNSSLNYYTYESLPMELNPVPPVDSIYYEKKSIKPLPGFDTPAEGCQVYLNTHDPANVCKFFRWNFTETWEFRLPYSKALNAICWATDNSSAINVKSTSVLAEDVVSGYPLTFISNQSDRLKVKYSILVNQFSLNEDEFEYWEKLKNVTQNVGSLYDVTPAAIPGNIFCVENPAEKVLGYFSVSSRSSKRIFIRDQFLGQVNLYASCFGDTIFGTRPITNLNVTTWILEQDLGPTTFPPYTVVTYTQGCADCTVRGSKIKPDFWNNNKGQ